MLYNKHSPYKEGLGLVPAHSNNVCEFLGGIHCRHSSAGFLSFFSVSQASLSNGGDVTMA